MNFMSRSTSLGVLNAIASAWLAFRKSAQADAATLAESAMSIVAWLAADLFPKLFEARASSTLDRAPEVLETTLGSLAKMVPTLDS